MSKKGQNSPAPPKKHMAKDAMINVLSGLGTSKDIKTANEWKKAGYDPELLDTVYSEHWLARKCVDVPADESVAKWRTIDTPSMAPEQASAFATAEKSRKLRPKIREALALARKYGGAAIYTAVEGQDITQPLDVAEVRKGQKVNFIVLNRNEVSLDGAAIDGDEFSENYGKPRLLTIKKTGKKIHYSRFQIFRGPCASDRSFGDLAEKFWGRSIFDSSLISAIERCESAMDSLDRSLEQATVDVLKIPDLFMKLADPEATRLLRLRIAEGAMTRSVYRMSLVDSAEEFIRAEATGSLSSGAQVLQMLLQAPSGATGIPVTKLLGISPGGLNATGESDSENLYTMLGAIRDNEIEPALDVIDKILCQVLFGKTFVDWSFKWESFWSSDKTEDSTIELNRVNGIVQAVQNQIMPPAVALRQLYEDGTYSALTEEIVNEFETFEDDEETEPAPNPEEMSENAAETE